MKKPLNKKSIAIKLVLLIIVLYIWYVLFQSFQHQVS